MNLIESIKSALTSVFSNKMRSFLTMLGIIIGISSVIMITSVGHGSQSAITDEFDKLGVSLLNVRLKDTNKAKENDYFTDTDINLIKKHPEVKSVSPLYQNFGAEVKLRKPNETKSSIIFGVNSDYRFVEQPTILFGRYFIKADENNRNKVVVISDTLAQKIFGKTNVVGEKISIVTWRGSFKYSVIGIIKDPNASFASLFGDQIPAMVYLPFETALDLFGENNFDTIVVTTKNMNTMDKTAAEISDMLNRKHRTDDSYYVENPAKSLEQVNKILGIITTFITFVASISLLVGGIGVMNIMLVTVTERTREIGIRKSLGAKNRDIRVQFLIEALIITFIGGIIGMVLGYIGGILVGQYMHIVPKMSPSIVLIAVLISSAIGIIFGVYPANKAAKLDPIEALRYE